VDIALKLEKQSNVDQVFYFERDFFGKISREYVEKSISYSDAVIVICSENTFQSEWLMKEFQIGLYLDKPIIPVFKNVYDIPPLLLPRKGVEYDTKDFDRFIDNLLNILDKLTGLRKFEKFVPEELAKTFKPLNIFLSYSGEDLTVFRVQEIANDLEKYAEINEVFFWREEYMDDYPYKEIDADWYRRWRREMDTVWTEHEMSPTVASRYMELIMRELDKQDILVLFCSPNSMKSEAVNQEWISFNAIGKKIIPVFINIDHIPPLLRSNPRIQYDPFDHQKLINNLHQLILSKPLKKPFEEMLDEHPKTYEKAINPPFEPYTGDQSFLFISYAHDDKSIVYPIIKRLHDDGFRIWYDGGVHLGEDWIKKVANSIEKCEVYNVFMSLNVLESRITKDELNYAYRKSRRKGVEKPKICSIFIDELNIEDLPSELDFMIGPSLLMIGYKKENEDHYIKIKNDLEKYRIKN
jgi:hypothetical protein